jgi:hypothetical protein
MVQGWSPELKGFMSGLAVCGAGAGSFRVVWTTIGRALMDPTIKGPAVCAQAGAASVQLLAFSIVFFLLLGITSLRTPHIVTVVVVVVPVVVVVGRSAFYYQPEYGHWQLPVPVTQSLRAPH